MSNISRMIDREMSKSNGHAKVYYGGGVTLLPYLNPVDEWIKWLSYNLEDSDRKKLDLFCKYRDGLCTEEEYMIVLNYMKKSITKLMKKKLPDEGVIFCNNVIKLLNKQSDEKISEYILIHKDDYNDLSMTDAYIYHYVCLIAFKRDLNNLDNEIRSMVSANDAMSDRSIILAKDRI